MAYLEHGAGAQEGLHGPDAASVQAGLQETILSETWPTAECLHTRMTTAGGEHLTEARLLAAQTAGPARPSKKRRGGKNKEEEAVPAH